MVQSHFHHTFCRVSFTASSNMICVIFVWCSHQVLIEKTIICARSILFAAVQVVHWWNFNMIVKKIKVICSCAGITLMRFRCKGVFLECWWIQSMQWYYDHFERQLVLNDSKEKLKSRMSWLYVLCEWAEDKFEDKLQDDLLCSLSWW